MLVTGAGSWRKRFGKPNAMNDQDRQQAIRLITEHWRKSRSDTRPASVWIRETLTPSETSVARETVSAWLLDEEGLHPRTIEEWEQFAASEQYQERHQSRLAQYKIGLAEFGPTPSHGWAASVIYGPLNGVGWEWNPQDSDRLWLVYY